MQKQQFLGIVIKSRYSLRHLLSIPFMYIIIPIIVYMIQIQIIFLLRDPDYFNVSSLDIGFVSNDIIFWSMIFQIVASLTVGYVYDIVGRPVTLFFLFLIGSVSIFVMPLASPQVFPWVYIFRALYAIFYAGVISHPLINDFVMRDSRGRAIALQNLGYVMGELLNIIAVQSIVQRFDFTMQFQSVAVFAMTMVLFFLYLIREDRQVKGA